SHNTPAEPDHCGGSATITWTYTSTCATASSCTRTFTVAAAPAITLTCPGNRTVGYCQRTQTFTPSVSGGCAPVTTTCTPPSGTTFPVGVNTVTCNSSDICSSANCSFTIT